MPLLPRKHGYLVAAPMRSAIHSAIEQFLVFAVAVLVVINHWNWWVLVLDTHWLVWHIYALKWDYVHLFDPTKVLWGNMTKQIQHVTVEAEREYRFQVWLLTLVDLATVGRHIDIIVEKRHDDVAEAGELWVQLGVIVAVALFTATRVFSLFYFQATDTHMNALNEQIYGDRMVNNGPVSMKQQAVDASVYRFGKHNSSSFFE